MKDGLALALIVSSLGLLLFSRLLPTVQGDLQIHPQEIAVGEISRGSRHFFQFEVMNTGSSEFGFKLHKSCGCQELTVEKGVISKGQTTIVGGFLEAPVRSDNRMRRLPIVLEYWEASNERVRFGKKIVVSFKVSK